MEYRGFNAYNKYVVLRYGFQENNISKTCEIFNISRTTFYNWNREYKKHGMKGLEKKERRTPNMPNITEEFIEQVILEYVIKNPKDGPRRIYYEMKNMNIDIGESGIYNVLRRNNLNIREKREKYSKIHINKENSKNKLNI